jgi:hypothetical protein
MHYYGARYHSPKLSVWMSVDRFASKYPNVTAYSYTANNLINSYDINGDSLWVENRTGFLGLKKENLLFVDGYYYNSDGSEFTGKLSSFSIKAQSALTEVMASREAGTAIQELSESKNNYVIKWGASEFESSSTLKANHKYYCETLEGYEEKLAENGIDRSGGSRGIVYWDPNGVVLPTTAGGLVNASTDLAHELFHAHDAMTGSMNSTEVEGVKMNEWQATFRENQTRSQLGIPLRTHYGQEMTPSGEYIRGTPGTEILRDNKPYLPK